VGVPFWLSLIIVVPLSFVMGALVFRLMIRPVLGASDHTMVVICIGSSWLRGDQPLDLGRGPARVSAHLPDHAWTIGGSADANNLGHSAFALRDDARAQPAVPFHPRWACDARLRAEREKSPLVGIPVETMLDARLGTCRDGRLSSRRR